MKKARVGRPPKYSEPSNPITVTLPLRTLQQLEEIDSDRSKAIVKCVDTVADKALAHEKRVEVVPVADNTGLIVVGPSRYLAKIPNLRLIEIAPARYLLSLSVGTDVAALELGILDMIEHLNPEETEEKEMFEALRFRLAQHRRVDGFTKGEILFVDI